MNIFSRFTCLTDDEDKHSDGADTGMEPCMGSRNDGDALGTEVEAWNNEQRSLRSVEYDVIADTAYTRYERAGKRQSHGRIHH
jgi:hypothetical protein